LVGGIFQGSYDDILLDCPPYLSPLTLNALIAADLLIIPVQCELHAAHSLRHVIGLARQIREDTNPGLDCRVLVTMYDGRTRISRLILDQMQHELGQLLFKTIIQIDTKVRECPAWGKPITLYAPKSRAAQQYRALAQELQGPAALGREAQDTPRLLHQHAPEEDLLEAELSERKDV
jgi:chromosome partitioning protein